MIRINFNARLILDDHFVKWAINHEQNYRIFTGLMRVNLSSLEYRKCHNVMLRNDYKSISNEGKIKQVNLGASIKPLVLLPSFIQKIPSIDQRVLLAIYLANDKPYKSYIFTIKKQKGKYLDNKHLKGVKSVIIRCEDEAMQIIKTYDKQFCDERRDRHW